jgi:hypothetical protein
MSTPAVSYESHYVEQRSRLTTFFRIFLVIPHFIVWYFYALAAIVVLIAAWFAIVFTGRYPRGMYDFIAGFSRFQTRLYGYAYLLTDEYPPFSGDPARSYPVDLKIGPPLESYDRLKTAFRLILAIPVAIVGYAMGIVAQLGAVIAWFAIVILGRQPKAIQEMIDLGLSYQMRAGPYYGLLTEDWPPFSDSSSPRMESGPSPGPLPPARPEAPASSGFAAPEAPQPLSAPPPATPPPPAPGPGDDEPPKPGSGGLTSGDPLG